jgi:predicted urease superfamily metal-dependent hydrolase
MEQHTYKRPIRGGQSCEVCGSLPCAVVHLLSLRSMEEAEREMRNASGLTERMVLEKRI